MNLKFNNHKDTKSEKKQIWIYALILFTGAFIVLLLTAYSQVKFQNNISDYQNKLTSEEKAKINVVTDLNTAIKDIKKLKEEIDSLNQKLVESEQKIATEEERSSELELKSKNETVAADMLLTAFEYYNQEDYINSALTLKYDVNKVYLSSKGLKSYEELTAECFEKASKILYGNGYRNYKSRNYSEAIIDLNRAIGFAQKDEYYVDDAYYYLAYAYYRASNYQDAKRIILAAETLYPRSSFIKDLKSLYRKMP